jgi:hypothetical protein
MSDSSFGPAFLFFDLFYLSIFSLPAGFITLQTGALPDLWRMLFLGDSCQRGGKQGTAQPYPDILNEKTPFKDVQKGSFPAAGLVGFFPVRLTRKGVC